MKKKATERFFVEWFIEKIGWDSCKVFDDEGPDFKIEFPDKLIVLDRTYESGMFYPATDEISLPDYGFSSVYLGLYPENYIKID